MTIRGTFTGAFRLDRPLEAAHLAYLDRYCAMRHMKLSEALLANRPDPLREAVGLPIGPEGAYYTGPLDDNAVLDPAVLDHTDSPAVVPDLLCQWKFDDSGTQIIWEYDDVSEKIVCFYVQWMEFIISDFLGPWGYRVNGFVHWETDPYPFSSEFSLRNAPAISRGDLVVTDNVIRVRNEKLEWLNDDDDEL